MAVSFNSRPKQGRVCNCHYVFFENIYPETGRIMQLHRLRKTSLDTPLNERVL